MGNNLMQTDLSVWGMYQHADIVVKCVMIGLILASVVTWAIFFSKSLEFFTQKRRLKREQQLLADARSLDQANEIAAGFDGKSLGAQLIYEAQNELELSEGSDDNVIWDVVTATWPPSGLSLHLWVCSVPYGAS